MNDDRLINILYVSPFGHYGGGEVSLITIINNLDRKRYNPSVVCYEKGHFIAKLEQNNINFRIISRRFRLLDIILIFRLAGFIKKNKIDLVHVNSLDIRAAIAAKLAGVPFLGHLRVIFPFTWVDRFFVYLSDITISVSKAAAEALSRSSAQLRKKLLLIPCVIDSTIKEVVPAGLKKEYGLSDGAKLVGIVARIDPFKGHDVFLRAAAIIKKSVPQAKFLIIGGSINAKKDEAIYTRRLRVLIEKLGLVEDVIFTGFRDDILSVMSSLDVLVAPSRQVKTKKGIKNEGFGRIAPEAMCLGVPVVVSASGGLAEIVDDKKNGFVVPPEDYKQTAQAVITLLTDTLIRRELCQAAKEKFDRCFSSKVTMGLTCKVYEQLMSERSAGKS